LGRFLSVDPVQFREDNIFSFNRYAYANNNPYRYFDPDGREPKASIGIDMHRGSFLNSRSDCPGQCTLVHNPDGRKMYVPSGIAHQVVSANAKGLTLDQEQKTPSAIDGLKALGTAASIAIILSPASAVVAGPIGLAADLAVGAAERDPLVLMPAAVGSGVKAGLKAGKIRESVSARISAGAELLIGRKKEETR
jgi:hypothetical protein